ncbi:hypothetical protein SAMN04489867_2096 [Pedococcus dokdonensis]|uniref:Uncharacterized protein n=1 Tax=Pedococcus dokdonensis TaxID=443156 RepID=A0A1H0RUR1_9MICO|nr:hypothetical protein SAMN04489867_2096 [Pedococcus dokdonensis]
MSRITALPKVASLLSSGLAAVTLTACGTADPPIPPATTTSSTTAPAKASFPLTISRVGGIAGFTDNLSIQDDGGVLAVTKNGQVTCTLDEASLAVLNEAALQVHDTDQPTGPPQTASDQLDVLFGAGTGMLRVNDPRVAGAEPVVNQLLADVNGPKASRKLCT